MTAIGEKIQSPVVRYRKGVRLPVPFELRRSLRADIGLIEFDLKQRQEKILPIKDGMGWGVAVNSTWTQMLCELIREFERVANYQNDGSWKVPLAKFIDLSSQELDAPEVWTKLREAIYLNIDLLSGWRWCPKRYFASSMPIYRKDGKYFAKSPEGEEAEVIGGKTAIEERLDFIADAITRHGGLLHECLRLLALANTERLFQVYPGRFPKSLRIELGESDSGTFFLHWRWNLRWPYTMQPTDWRPDDNYCDPQWLANDLLAFFAEKEVTDTRDEVQPPDPALVEKWANEFRDAKRQMSFALESRLQIGKNSEAWLAFRGHTYRWRNRTQNAYPIIITAYAAGESDRDVVARTFKFMSHLTFQFDAGIECEFWVGSMSSFNPAVSNPFRQGYSSVPDGIFEETHGTDIKRLDLALSLYREGISSNSIFYQMLSYFKVVQLAFNDKRKLVDGWIEKNSTKTLAFKESNFQMDLAKSGWTVSQYLYEASRNSIAHVNLGSKGVADPDNIDDHRRVSVARPLVRQLAQEAIKQGLF